eukprot:jgi/Mesvir1/23912/Mv10690-RA.1
MEDQIPLTTVGPGGDPCTCGKCNERREHPLQGRRYLSKEWPLDIRRLDFEFPSSPFFLAMLSSTVAVLLEVARRTLPWFASLCPSLSIQPVAHTIMGGVVGFLVVIRLNSSYSRHREGWVVVYDLVSSIKSYATLCATLLGDPAQAPKNNRTAPPRSAGGLPERSTSASAVSALASAAPPPDPQPFSPGIPLGNDLVAETLRLLRVLVHICRLSLRVNDIGHPSWSQQYEQRRGRVCGNILSRVETIDWSCRCLQLHTLLSAAEIQEMSAFEETPAYVLCGLRKSLIGSSLPAPLLGTLHMSLNTMTLALSQCKRIAVSSMAYSMVGHLRRLLLLFLCTLPSALLGVLPLALVLPAHFIISFAFLGIEAAATETDQPFGYDFNDIPLDKIFRSLLHELDDINRDFGIRCPSGVCAHYANQPFWMEPLSG